MVVVTQPCWCCLQGCCDTTGVGAVVVETQPVLGLSSGLWLLRHNQYWGCLQGCGCCDTTGVGAVFRAVVVVTQPCWCCLQGCCDTTGVGAVVVETQPVLGLSSGLWLLRHNQYWGCLQGCGCCDTTVLGLSSGLWLL